MDEFALISKLFAPLARGAGADGLRDDVARLEPPNDHPIIVTTDALVEGVHFLASDPLDTVARKLVRVNVSDIIAKGAEPFAASLTLVWPKGRDHEALEAFAVGLGEDLTAFGIDLIGGDTTSTGGPLTLSMTLHGACCTDFGPIRRCGAQVGDRIMVTGAIGAGRLGLKAALGKIEGPDLEAWLTHYRIPQIQSLEIAGMIANSASASIDVSDGLLADLAHICAASGVKARLFADRVPTPAGFEPSSDAELLELLTGGDDYQILFTCAPERVDDVFETGAPVAEVGEVLAGEGVELLGVEGTISSRKTGWTHF